jgi:hypothetical protein
MTTDRRYTNYYAEITWYVDRKRFRTTGCFLTYSMELKSVSRSHQSLRYPRISQQFIEPKVHNHVHKSQTLSLS